MKKLLLTCMLAMVALFAVACGSDTGAGKEQKQEKITVKHELGETEVVKNPKKVVVFDFGMLDSLDTLG
ncbi:MAG: ABC transporter, partial [Bacillaceae bacterium]